ncbi:hypothetical protein [Allocoleopsis sp.]|uniref:hypothetical protein n=1 Tax=Allocoleopsis sp. TaxID=3088169 RepID=UPI002FD6F176
MCRVGEGAIASMLMKALTNGIRGYTTEVRLRGLTKSQGFNKITRVGGFCLYSCGFQPPSPSSPNFIIRSLDQPNDASLRSRQNFSFC